MRGIATNFSQHNQLIFCSTLWFHYLSCQFCEFLIGIMYVFFCLRRFGIQLVKKDSKVLEWLSIEVLTAVFLCMMLTSWSHLTILTIGGRSSLSRFFFKLKFDWDLLLFHFPNNRLQTCNIENETSFKPCAGKSIRSREFPIRSHRKQNWCGWGKQQSGTF